MSLGAQVFRVVCPLLLCGCLPVICRPPDVHAQDFEPDADLPEADEPREPASGSQDEEATARLYRTHAERREVGLQRQITSWLTASGLAEGFEVRRSDKTDHEKETSATIQLGLTATPLELAKGEVLWEYDTDRDKIVTDEAILSVEQGDLELEVGRQHTPPGIYISHLRSGPILEFGETSSTGVAFSYGPDDSLDIKVMVYRGRAREIGTDSSRMDWSAGIESWLGQSCSLGMSYQSDLADSDDKLLDDEEGNRFDRKVPAVSGYAVWTTRRFDLSVEALGTMRSFREFDRDRNRPWAWNVEFSQFLALTVRLGTPMGG